MYDLNMIKLESRDSFVKFQILDLSDKNEFSQV